MAVVETFPDAEAVAIKHLRTDQTIAQARVHGRVPDNPTFPLHTLHRVGGIPAEKHVLDVATLHVDTWGNSKPEARYAAAQARASLMRLEGQTISVLMDGIEVGAHVTKVEDALGLMPMTDPDTDRDRYQFQVNLTLRAITA